MRAPRASFPMGARPLPVRRTNSSPPNQAGTLSFLRSVCEHEGEARVDVFRIGRRRGGYLGATDVARRVAAVTSRGDSCRLPP